MQTLLKDIKVIPLMINTDVVVIVTISSHERNVAVVPSKEWLFQVPVLEYACSLQ